MLPEAYKYYLRTIGKWLGGNDHWINSYRHLEYNNLEYNNIDVREEYAETIEEYAQEMELPLLPEHSFIFASRLGEIHLFFIADGTDDDPPIYYFGDQREHNMEKRYDSFWDWFEESVIYFEYYNKKGYYA
ncbi:MAG: SMI1/KNR4 family protein [Oscillatoriales cyanobacterium C42_A2020_001]|nr:SMI1/KNR4 family protein [Leptolyngbyaceae cyanobacterium C42_A2020_001]